MYFIGGCMAVIILTKDKRQIITIDEDIKLEPYMSTYGYRMDIKSKNGIKLGEYQDTKIAEV